MAALHGLSGLYPDPPPVQDYMDEGVLEARANDPAPEHGTYGVAHLGYSGAVPIQSPYSGFSVYDGFDPASPAQFVNAGTDDYYPLHTPGMPDDLTPTTHASPTPRIGLSSMQSWDNPNGAAEVGQQLRQLHSPELGGVYFYQFTAPAGREEETHYTTDMYIAPNENYLSDNVPDQLKSVTFGGTGASGGGSRGGSGGGGSNADTTQGYGKLNTLTEFNAGHSIRRQQHDRMPWDFTATHGEQDVPFYGRHPVEQMPLDGPDSPYFMEGNIDGANVPWEGRIGDPTVYIQPPEPDISNSPIPQADYYPALSF